MKKLLLTTLSCCLFLSLFAQNETYRHTLTGGVGASFFGFVVDVVDGTDFSDSEFANTSDEFTINSGLFRGKSLPAFQVNYDYGFKKWFSLGGGISYQKFDVDFQDLQYTEDTGEQNFVESAAIDVHRLNIGIRTLFHYGNSNRIDMYSGFRLGLTNWGISASSSDVGLEGDLNSVFGLLPSFQFIPFALRGYVTENLGIQFETGIGTPHMFAFGVNYRM